MKVVPYLLTCERELLITKQFVNSFKKVQIGLAKPICVIDTSASSDLSSNYLSLIDSLHPKSIHIHHKEVNLTIYSSVQEAVHWGFNRVLAETDKDDLILFIEDDILFSKLFLKKLYSYPIKPDTGFITFYLPYNGYGSQTILPEQFYGTQCVLFPRPVIVEIMNNYDYMKKKFTPGYDKQWAAFLFERGYKLYCTDYSYVQHLGLDSKLHNKPSHLSTCFINGLFSYYFYSIKNRLGSK